MRRRSDRDLKLSHALALGVLHGPAELLPVSSSAHTTLVPWLLGWPYPQLDPELRKAFEVALHAGTAAALLVGLRDEVADAARGFDRRRATLVIGSFLPPAIVGYTLERPIERRLGTPETIAAGLAAGAAAMWLADARAPQRRARTDAGRRRRARARARAGVRARARRLAQRRDAHGGAGARVPPAGRERAVAPRRAAGDRRRDGPEGRAPRAPGAAGRRGRGVRGGDRRGVLLDARLGAAHPRRRARPAARAVRRLPPRARRDRVAARAAIR